MTEEKTVQIKFLGCCWNCGGTEFKKKGDEQYTCTSCGKTWTVYGMVFKPIEEAKE